MRREEEIIRESLRNHGFKYFHPRRLSRNVWVYIIGVILLMQAMKAVWSAPSAVAGEDFKTGLPLGSYVDVKADFSALLPGFDYKPKTKSRAAWYFRCRKAPEIGFHFVVSRHMIEHHVLSLYVTSSSPVYDPPPEVTRLSTKRGIHLGSRRIDVLARYGYPFSYETRTQRRGYILMSYQFRDATLSFLVNDSALVSEMSLTPAQRGYPR